MAIVRDFLKTIGPNQWEPVKKAHLIPQNIHKLQSIANRTTANRHDDTGVNSETETRQYYGNIISQKTGNYSLRVVARERFELSSKGPKPSMLDHYTTGLYGFKWHLFYLWLEV